MNHRLAIMNIAIASESDKSEILEYITQGFIQYDPLVNYMSLTSSELKNYFEPYINFSIEQKYAVIARSDAGDFVGTTVSHDYMYNPECLMITKNIQNYIEFFNMLCDDVQLANILNIFMIDAGLILCGGFVTVNPKYYGKNILAIMDEYLLKLAKQNGFKYILAEFTNPCNYSLHKRDYGDVLQVINRLRYSDFRNLDGDYPMKNAYGECILTLMEINAGLPV